MRFPGWRILLYLLNCAIKRTIMRTEARSERRLYEHKHGRDSYIDLWAVNEL